MGWLGAVMQLFQRQQAINAAAPIYGRGSGSASPATALGGSAGMGNGSLSGFGITNATASLGSNYTASNGQTITPQGTLLNGGNVPSIDALQERNNAMFGNPTMTDNRLQQLSRDLGSASLEEQRNNNPTNIALYEAQKKKLEEPMRGRIQISPGSFGQAQGLAEKYPGNFSSWTPNDWNFLRSKDPLGQTDAEGNPTSTAGHRGVQLAGNDTVFGVQEQQPIQMGGTFELPEPESRPFLGGPQHYGGQGGRSGVRDWAPKSPGAPEDHSAVARLRDAKGPVARIGTPNAPSPDGTPQAAEYPGTGELFKKPIDVSWRSNHGNIPGQIKEDTLGRDLANIWGNAAQQAGQQISTGIVKRGRELIDALNPNNYGRWNPTPPPPDWDPPTYPQMESSLYTIQPGTLEKVKPAHVEMSYMSLPWDSKHIVTTPPKFVPEQRTIGPDFQDRLNMTMRNLIGGWNGMFGGRK